jgi:hypothetical protein
MVSFERIVGIMGWKALATRLYSLALLKLDIDKDKWLKNLPMSEKNGVHIKHVKAFLEKKIDHLP